MNKQKLSPAAQKLLTEIKQDGDSAPVAALASDYIKRDGWSELTRWNLVNTWSDDTGTKFVEPGPQQ